jgi:hypothetical protein
MDEEREQVLYALMLPAKTASFATAGDIMVTA